MGVSQRRLADQMASYRDESVDGYLYSYTGRYPKPRDAGWKYKSYLNSYADADAYNNHQRAKLKSILSQINPKLTPRLRKANTKDVAVQVNPRVDASVQCELGPRTLVKEKRDTPCVRPEAPPLGSPRGAGVRYPRTLGVFSPIAYRRVSTFFVKESDLEASFEAQKAEPPESAGGSQALKEAKPEAENGVKKAAGRRKKPKAKRPANVGDVQLAHKESLAKDHARFQFLEQKYGYYRCRECNVRWESAYVWCVQGTNKVYFKQLCRKCQNDFNPFHVEDLACPKCNKARCTCAVTSRHVDPRRPHRQDLCGRCKGRWLSCESKFSFKYII